MDIGKINRQILHEMKAENESENNGLQALRGILNFE